MGHGRISIQVFFNESDNFNSIIIILGRIIMADIQTQDIKKEGVGSGDIIQLVTFNLGDEEFGIDILIVKEIIRLVDITRVPNAPDYVEGVINLRGKVVPIIDLRKRLGMSDIERTSNSRIIVVDLDSKVIGFIVDKVNEVLRIDKSTLEDPPPMTTGVDAEFLTSIAKLENRLISFLDLEKLISG